MCLIKVNWIIVPFIFEILIFLFSGKCDVYLRTFQYVFFLYNQIGIMHMVSSLVNN